MGEKLEETKKIIKRCVLAITLMVVVMGFTSMADTFGKINGSYSGGVAHAWLNNNNSNSRFCELYIQAGSNVNSLSTIKYASGTISARNSLSCSKSSSASHIRGKGIIYKGGNPNAGSGWTGVTWIK